ncbi:hypothetical protein [Mucilaginibacter conchicola]|nr:hypothetical protein [Mucilaginibacter conchicola]
MSGKCADFRCAGVQMKSPYKYDVISSEQKSGPMHEGDEKSSTSDK